MASPASGGLIDFLIRTPERILGVCVMCLLGGVVLGVAGHCYLNKPPAVVCPPPKPPKCWDEQMALQAVQTLHDTTPKLKSLGDGLESLRRQCSQLESRADGGAVVASPGRGASSAMPPARPCAEPAALDSLRRMHQSHLVYIDQANACKLGIEQYEKTFRKMARAIGPKSDSEKSEMRQVKNYIGQTVGAIEKRYLAIPLAERAVVRSLMDEAGRDLYSLDAQNIKLKLLQDKDQDRTQKVFLVLALAKALRVLQGLEQGLGAGLEPLSDASEATASKAREDRESIDKAWASVMRILSQAGTAPEPAKLLTKSADASIMLCQVVRTLEQLDMREVQPALERLAVALEKVAGPDSAGKWVR